jgi:hypothetical protein
MDVYDFSMNHLLKESPEANESVSQKEYLASILSTTSMKLANEILS